MDALSLLRDDLSRPRPGRTALRDVTGPTRHPSTAHQTTGQDPDHRRVVLALSFSC